MSEISSVPQLWLRPSWQGQRLQGQAFAWQALLNRLEHGRLQQA